MANKTLFGAAFNSISQICQCEFQKLHKSIKDKADPSWRHKELDLWIEKNSLIDKMFGASNNLLYQMTANNIK